MKRETLVDLAVVVFLVALGVTLREVSNRLQLWNFAPVTATALFAGFYLSRRWVAALVPLAILAIGDAFFRDPYSSDMRPETVVWLPLAIYAMTMWPVILRGLLRNRKSGLSRTATAMACAVGTATAFFVVTNFANWLVFAEVYSTETFLENYAVAVPFYGNTLASDLVWTAVFFGAYAAAVSEGFLPAVEVREETA